MRWLGTGRLTWVAPAGSQPHLELSPFWEEHVPPKLKGGLICRESWARVWPTTAPHRENPQSLAQPLLAAPLAPTHGHVIIRGVSEAQQQLRPLAAQLVGLVLGLQLHLYGTTEGRWPCSLGLRVPTRLSHSP